MTRCLQAGITTILNSRTAVLAAANPVFGRYDDDRSAAENIDFLPTILSRFDLIFIVRDVRNAVRDEAMARHVMRVHINASAEVAEDEASALLPGLTGSSLSSSASAPAAGETIGELDMTRLRRFISYVRARVAPTMNQSALEKLRAEYVKIRSEHRAAGTAGDESVVPITVRQLEALVRLSEAVAKCSLSTEVTDEHVEESVRLFKAATLDASKSGIAAGGVPEALAAEVRKVEARLQREIAVGSTVNLQRLKANLKRLGHSSNGIEFAMRIMHQRGEINYVNQRFAVQRAK